MQTNHEETIRDRAYALWVEAGSPEGNDWQFWHEAERQLAENGEIDMSEDAAEVTQPPLPAGMPAH
jgi:hypothetical protein